MVPHARMLETDAGAWWTQRERRQGYTTRHTRQKRSQHLEDLKLEPKRTTGANVGPAQSAALPRRESGLAQSARRPLNGLQFSDP